MASPIATDEQDLLLRLHRGDYLAFDKLYSDHTPSALSKLKKLVHLHEVAEELHQDIFLKTWEDRERLPLDVPFRAVVLRKARSAAYNFYRKVAHDQDLREELIRTATELHNPTDDAIAHREASQAIEAAISRLPQQRQKIFRAIKTDGKSYEEVANEFGVSLSTVKDHMAKAMRFLRGQLAGQASAYLFIVFAAYLFD